MQFPMMTAFARITLTGCLFLFLSACSNLLSGVTSQMADDLASSILSSEDIDTVREGIPAYLLLIDSFLQSSPDSVDLLLAASTLNGSFAVLVDDEDRVKLLSAKAMRYAEHAACVDQSPVCGGRSLPFGEFENAVAELNEEDVPTAYALAVAWVGRLQANSDDWAVIAELSRAKALMARIIELNEEYENGGPHLYMGGMETLLPASLGGQPEKGRGHFEKAIAINESYLMTKVIYAEQYARLVFDQVTGEEQP